MSDLNIGHLYDELQREERRRGVPATPEAPPAKPLGATEVARMLLQRMAAQQSGEHSSVKLTRNAKGDTQIEVTVRTGDGDDAETVSDCAAKARATYDTLRGFYPMSATTNGSDQ